MATIALVAAGLLIYVSGSFIAAEIAGVKRYLQVVLLLPIAVAASYYIMRNPRCVLNPLIGFVVLKSVAEVALRGQWLYILENFTTLLALIALTAAPARSIVVGAKFVVILATFLASLGLLQWTLLFIDPQLADFRLIMPQDGVVENSVKHPIALLGLMSEPAYTLFGYPVARLQSFAMEPSLNVVYFMLPASLAFLQKSRFYAACGGVIALFCVLSLSGSVFLAFAFTCIWWLLLRFVSFKFAVSYGILGVMAAYLFFIQVFGFEQLLNGIAFISQYGDFLSKSASLTDRGSYALSNMQAALVSPLGSATLSDMPGPWLVNATLAAGWGGAILLLAFLRNLARELELLNGRSRRIDIVGIGSLLLLGVLATVIVFNDYQMSNYPGLVLLAFVYGTMRTLNENTKELPTVERAGPAPA